MTDRRALIIGSWLSKGRDKPSSQKIRSITTRWAKLFQSGKYNYKGLRSKRTLPKTLHNTTLADIVSQITSAGSITEDTELPIHFVGHSTSVGENDIALVLGVEKDGKDRVCRLTYLLDTIYKQTSFKKLVLILDTCHAGRTTQSFEFIKQNTFATFGTGDNYAFDANFSDGVLSALEQPIRKNDQRIDRRVGGITYHKIFEDARRKVISNGSKQIPQCFGDYGSEVVLKAPVSVPVEFNPFASQRSVYGRVYSLLNIIKRETPDWSQLYASIRNDKNFLLRREEEGPSKFLSTERLGEYVDFLRAAKLIVQPKSRFELTAAGLDACNQQTFNRAILAAIEKDVFASDVTFEFVDEVVKDLLFDMIPPTPIRIKDRAAMKGRSLILKTPTRLAIQLLPSTGQFLKGSADAIFPSEFGGELSS